MKLKWGEQQRVRVCAIMTSPFTSKRTLIRLVNPELTVQRVEFGLVEEEVQRFHVDVDVRRKSPPLLLCSAASASTLLAAPTGQLKS